MMRLQKPRGRAMAETPITETELAEWHELAINTVADALVGDTACKLRMASSASDLAFAVLRLLAERTTAEAQGESDG
jgi:hypothetical protein